MAQGDGPMPVAGHGGRRRGCIAAVLALPALYRMLTRPQKVIAIALAAYFVVSSTILIGLDALKPQHFDPARAPWVYLHVAGDILFGIGITYLFCAMVLRYLPAAARRHWLFYLGVAIVGCWFITTAYNRAVFLLPAHALPTFDQLIPVIARPLDRVGMDVPLWPGVGMLYLWLVINQPRVRQLRQQVQPPPAPDAPAQP